MVPDSVWVRAPWLHRRKPKLTGRGTTPFSLDLNNHTSHTVVFRQRDIQEVTCQLTTSVGAGWVILDVLVGLIVDAATGKWNSLDQGVCNVVLPAARGTNWEEDKKSY